MAGLGPCVVRAARDSHAPVWPRLGMLTRAPVAQLAHAKPTWLAHPWARPQPESPECVGAC